LFVLSFNFTLSTHLIHGAYILNYYVLLGIQSLSDILKPRIKENQTETTITESFIVNLG